MSSSTELLDRIERALNRAVDVLAQFVSGSVKADRKSSDGSLVTEADRSVNRVLQEFLVQGQDGWLRKKPRMISSVWKSTAFGSWIPWMEQANSRPAFRNGVYRWQWSRAGGQLSEASVIRRRERSSSVQRRRESPVTASKPVQVRRTGSKGPLFSRVGPRSDVESGIVFSSRLFRFSRWGRLLISSPG
jgi:hypothetical protein